MVSDMSDMHVRRAFKRLLRMIRLNQLVEISDVHKGSFEKIDFSPKGMFPETVNSFHEKQVIANKKFIKIFITQKGLMEKYTDRVILGMAYFEYFYMQQLKENKKAEKVEKDKKKKDKLKKKRSEIMGNFQNWIKDTNKLLLIIY